MAGTLAAREVLLSMLTDGARRLVETSIITEYLEPAHPGPVRLIPADPMAALDARFLDRFFDLNVMAPMQSAVAGALTGDAAKREEAPAQSAQLLERAYGWLEPQPGDRPAGRALVRPRRRGGASYRHLFTPGAPERD